MTHRVVILGAGFGGLELATRLADDLPDAVHVTLIDRNDSFVFGFAKLDVMVGRRELADVRIPYARFARPAVDFRQESVVSIDPVARRVVTDRDTYDADVLVVALGADIDPAATPGLRDGGYEFYSPEGAARLRDVIGDFDGGSVVVGVLGPLFKCPPAPYEAAFLLHDVFTQRGVRSAVNLHVVTPLPSPIPIAPDASASLLAALRERRIEHWASSTIASLDPDRRLALFSDGRALRYDLFLGVPLHRAPAVVVESGLTDDGWIAVDPATFATRFDGVYAIGDVTSAPVPRAGSIAEGEAATLADVLRHRLGGGPAPAPYAGRAACFIEMGGDTVARVDVTFLEGDSPTARFHDPSLDVARDKGAFAAQRLDRWFGVR